MTRNVGVNGVVGVLEGKNKGKGSITMAEFKYKKRYTLQEPNDWHGHWPI